jgi:hypothetical protein
VVRERRRAEITRDIIPLDGSEKPVTFAVRSSSLRNVEEEEQRDAVAADEARATRLDAQIPVCEYYAQDVFPVGALVLLATQNGRAELNQCELSFVVNGARWRKKRFHDEDQLRRFIAQTKPECIDVGPQYPPGDTSKEHHSHLNLRRYLVFDVDFDDSNYIRSCACKVTLSLSDRWNARDV